MAEVQCPTCEWRFEVADRPDGRQHKCPSCGELLLIGEGEARVFPWTPPPPPMAGSDQGTPHPLEYVVPVRNPAALWSYYLGLFAVIPCVGVGLAIAAIIQGKKGLDFANEHPEKLGKGHAVVGIFFAIFWMALWLAILVASGISNP